MKPQINRVDTIKTWLVKDIANKLRCELTESKEYRALILEYRLNNLELQEKQGTRISKELKRGLQQKLKEIQEDGQ